MGLYKLGVNENPNYKTVSKNIGELYQPTPNALKSISSEPIAFDIDFFNLSSSEQVVESNEQVDQKKVDEQKNAFFIKHFRL